MNNCNSENILEVALHYRNKHGFSVIPLQSKSKQPLITWQRYQNKIADESEIREWFTKWPNANIGIMTGRISNLVVLDTEKGADLSGFELPPTPTVKTGGGGQHFYYRPYSGLGVNTLIRFRPLMDLKNSGYVVAPPSIHHSGNPYKWSLSLDDEEIAELPSWIIASIMPQKPQHTTKEWEKITSGIVEGQRNISSASLIGKLLSVLPQKDWENVGWRLIRAWNTFNVPPLEEKELRATFNSISRAELSSRKNKLPQINETRDQFQYEIVSGNELLHRDFGPERWLVQSLIPEQSLNMWSGDPGNLKSLFALELTRSIIQEIPFLGKFATTKAKILIIDEENSERELQKRMRLIGIPNASDLFLPRQHGFKIDDSRYYHCVEQFIRNNKIELVIIDPFIFSHMANENDTGEMRNVMILLRDLTLTGVSILSLHHERKNTEGSRGIWQNMRGSSAIQGALNTHISIDKVKDEDNIIRLRFTQTKNRDGKKLDPFLVVAQFLPTKISFAYGGIYYDEKIELAIQAVLDVLLHRGELPEAEIVSECNKNECSKYSISRAIRTLLKNKKIKERVAKANKRFYSLC